MQPKQVPVQIQILSPSGTTRLVQFKARTLTVGRNNDNQLVLDDKQVSGQHLRLEVEADQIRVIDLGSRNGTQLANVKLAPNQPQVWAEHQALQVGHHTLTLLRTAGVPGQVRRWNWQPLFGLLNRYRVASSLPTWLLPLLNQPRLRPWRPAFVMAAGLLMVLWGWWAVRDRTQPTNHANAVILLPTFTSTPLANAALIPGAPPLATPTMLVITPMPGALSAAPPAVIGVSTLIPIYTPPPAAPALAAAQSASNGLVQAAQVSPSRRGWDSRLDQLGVTLEEANAQPGQLYWRLIDAQWQDELQATGKHHIYVEVLDQKGQRIVGQSVTVWWTDGSSTGQTENRAAPDYAYNFQMFAPGYSYSARLDDLPSDSVHNMGMGDIAHREMKIHTTFLLTFQKTVK